MSKVYIFGAIALALPSAGLSGADQDLLSEPPRFVAVDPISLPIVDGDRIDGQLNYAIVIEAKDDEAMARINASPVALRAAALRGGLDFARLYASSFSAVDARELTNSLTRALQQEDDGISGVLLVEVAALPS